MTPKLSHYYLARVTLETVTPLSVCAGGADGVFDVALVRDASGLPALPGSSIAGMLRHLYWEVYGGTAMTEVFGYQQGAVGDPSRLHVGWGALQDSTGAPVEGLLLGQAGKTRLADPLLRAALDSTGPRETRDRVRIGHRGAAAPNGKFDRTVLPAGYRFSAELSLWSNQAQDPGWQQVLALLAHPLFRLGGGSRAGLGRVKAVRVHTGHFDLSTAPGRTAFANVPRGLGDTAALTPLKLNPASPNRYLTATLTLKPSGFWRIGQGADGDDRSPRDGNGKPADLLPKLEARWDWGTTPPRVLAAELLVPASSIKGALAHRVAFHANRHARRWAEELLADQPDYDKSNDCPEVRSLFGFARDDKTRAGSAPRGQAGRVFLDDVFLTFGKGDLKLMMHNAIDRFTGGVREHMLFMEELVWQKEMVIPLMVDTDGVTDTARVALKEALDDLCGGRLAIGGGCAKGHGFCTGSHTWADDGIWLNGPVTPSSTVAETTSHEAA